MPYRDEYEALAARNIVLERELAANKAELERATRVRSLPLLDQIRIASPCRASWEAMAGDEVVRFCGQCSKHVYNLSGMTRDAAETLVRETEGKACVRFYRRTDGTLLTADCPVGARKLRFRRVAIAAVGAGILAVGAAWAMAAPTASRDVMGEMPMGVMVMPSPPPPAPTVHLFQGGPAAATLQQKMGKPAMPARRPPALAADGDSSPTR